MRSMRDYGHEQTDEILEKLEKKLTKEYKQASEEVRDKLNDYLRRFAEKDAIKQDQVRRGVITEAEYKRWRKGQIMAGKRWQQLRDSLADDFHSTNVTARNIITRTLPYVYALNHNWGTYQIERDTSIDTSYTLYDASTVNRILTEDPDLLPPPGKEAMKRIREGKDVRWNRQQIQSVMLQSILQGESIPAIATRLADAVGDGNRKAAIRNARTMTTGAENAGRVDSYKRAEKMGIELKQCWVATLDMRTRHEHRQADGQTVPVGEPFDIDGKKLRFPGDPSAPGYLVYNCRCTLIAQVSGHEHDVKGFSKRKDPSVKGMSYEAWKKSREERTNPITLPEEKAQAIRMAYIAGYKR